MLKLLLAFLWIPFTVGQAFALDAHQVELVELLIDFKIEGNFTCFTPEDLPIYTVNGPGFAPLWIFGSGEISDKTFNCRKVAELQGAEITFSGNPAFPCQEE